MLQFKVFFQLRLMLVLGVLAPEAYSYAKITHFDLCRNYKLVRTLRIENTSKGCAMYYTKAGKDHRMGLGKFSSSCEKVYKNIKDNIEAVGWKCKALSQPSISRSRL